MENIVSVLEKYTGFEAINKPGGQHVLNDDYFKRIEAINYTLEHDDGQGQLDLERADVIIVGVSRTSKTPTCIYLANQGIKAANYILQAVENAKMEGTTIRIYRSISDYDEVTGFSLWGGLWGNSGKIAPMNPKPASERTVNVKANQRELPEDLPF